MEVMLRNRYNYLTPFVQDTKGNKGVLRAAAPQSKQAESQKVSFFPITLAKRLSKIKTNYQGIHPKTDNDRNSKPQQNTALERSVKPYWFSMSVVYLLLYDLFLLPPEFCLCMFFTLSYFGPTGAMDGGGDIFGILLD